MASTGPARTWRVWNHLDHSEEKQKSFPEVVSTSLIIFLTSIKLLLTGQMSLLKTCMAWIGDLNTKVLLLNSSSWTIVGMFITLFLFFYLFESCELALFGAK